MENYGKISYIAFQNEMGRPANWEALTGEEKRAWVKAANYVALISFQTWGKASVNAISQGLQKLADQLGIEVEPTSPKQ